MTPEAKAQRAILQNTDPQVNQWICLAMLIICIGLLAATAEWVGYLLTDARHEALIYRTACRKPRAQASGR
jgi:hypothetical protein